MRQHEHRLQAYKVYYTIVKFSRQTYDILCKPEDNVGVVALSCAQFADGNTCFTSHDLWFVSGVDSLHCTSMCKSKCVGNFVHGMDNWNTGNNWVMMIHNGQGQWFAGPTYSELRRRLAALLFCRGWMGQDCMSGNLYTCQLMTILSWKMCKKKDIFQQKKRGQIHKSFESGNLTNRVCPLTTWKEVTIGRDSGYNTWHICGH